MKITLLIESPVHVECARQGGYALGFDVVPVKGSRRDQFNVVNMKGVVGTMTAAIWCKEHIPKTAIYQMNDIVDESGLNALQLYVQNFKQADLTLTGTVRKATLVNQSTKVVNTVSITQTPNRRSSTTATANGHSNPVRGSVSHLKAGDAPDISSIAGVTAKICATCAIDVSPKWWSYPPAFTNGAATNGATNGDAQTNGDHAISNEPPLVGSQAPMDTHGEDNGSHAALAAAALHQNKQDMPAEPTEFQCHQCHWKKVQKEPPPLPVSIPRELSQPPIIPTATINTRIPDVEVAQERSHYAWPAPLSYPTNGSYSSWSRHSPGPQGTAPLNQLNGSREPGAAPGAVQPPNVQTHVRQSSHHRPQSSHQNGHQNGHLDQVPNGYPPSPHHSIGSSTLHMQNGNYASSYVSTRPTPQHLTNGGPPPRAPEHPLSNAPMHPISSFGPPQGSPPMHRDPQGREHAQPSNNQRNDSRVNGGASASPSLRNLLS